MNVPRPPTSRVGRATWHLHHPAVALLCLAAMVASYWHLPLGNGGLWSRLEGRPLQAVSVHDAAALYLLRNPGSSEFEELDANKVSWDRLARLTQDRAQDLLIAGYSASVLRRGMWYPSQQLETRRVTLVAAADFVTLPQGETRAPFTLLELERARAQYVRWLGSPAGGNEPAVAEAIASGDQIIACRYPPFLWSNIGTAVAAAMFCLSLAGLRWYLRVWLARRRLARFRCGVCRYDLSSIQPSPTGLRCPECGADWGLSQGSDGGLRLEVSGGGIHAGAKFEDASPPVVTV